MGTWLWMSSVWTGSISTGTSREVKRVLGHPVADETVRPGHGLLAAVGEQGFRTFQSVEWPLTLSPFALAIARKSS